MAKKIYCHTSGLKHYEINKLLDKDIYLHVKVRDLPVIGNLNTGKLGEDEFCFPLNETFIIRKGID